MPDETNTPIAPVRQETRCLTRAQFERLQTLCKCVALDEQFLWLDLLCEVGAISYAEAWVIIADEIVPNSGLNGDE